MTDHTYRMSGGEQTYTEREAGLMLYAVREDIGQDEYERIKDGFGDNVPFHDFAPEETSADEFFEVSDKLMADLDKDYSDFL